MFRRRPDLDLERRLASVVEASRRTLGLNPYPPQLQAARLLIGGTIVELDTGEGKTLAGAMASVLHAQAGGRVWVSTANDYLAKRDADWSRPLLQHFGLKVSAVLDGMTQSDRRDAYDGDVIYGTLREFGFDYLRSRMAGRTTGATSADAALLGSEPFHNLLIVDEADSLLIDEARTPLIISRPGNKSDVAEEACLRWCAGIASQFVDPLDFEHEVDESQVALTDAGRRRLLSLPVDPAAAPKTLNDLMLALERAILVNLKYVRDRDYVVLDGKLLIVDEFTGRTSEGRTWSAGVHQALEAREHLELTPQSRTAAQITIQDFVGRFQNVAGMTGTAQESADELRSVYGLKVARVPPHRPSQRKSLPTNIFRTASDKWIAVANEAQRLRSAGKAVLIGTRTVEASEELAAVLDRQAVPHVLLSARAPEREAGIVAEAGQSGRVTVATNMAGRGTDIRTAAEVVENGGLHVIGTELHASSRIDRQLAGRCGRQGEPGCVQWFLSGEDAILKAGREEHVAKRPPITPVVADFHNAQRALERRHVHERLLLRMMTAETAKQYSALGLDPIVDVLEP